MVIFCADGSGVRLPVVMPSLWLDGQRQSYRKPYIFPPDTQDNHRFSSLIRSAACAARQHLAGLEGGDDEAEGKEEAPESVGQAPLKLLAGAPGQQHTCSGPDS